jgi:hypothetical protein
VCVDTRTYEASGSDASKVLLEPVERLGVAVARELVQRAVLDAVQGAAEMRALEARRDRKHARPSVRAKSSRRLVHYRRGDAERGAGELEAVAGGEVEGGQELGRAERVLGAEVARRHGGSSTSAP